MSWLCMTNGWVPHLQPAGGGFRAKLVEVVRKDGVPARAAAIHRHSQFEAAIDPATMQVRYPPQEMPVTPVRSGSTSGSDRIRECARITSATAW